MAEKKRILVVSDESGMGLGGVPVFNQLLTVGLAENPDHTVDLLYVTDRPQPHGRANVHAVSPVAGEDKMQTILKAAQQKPEDFGLPAGGTGTYDIVIGHSRFSGAAASAMQAAWYPDAVHMNFLHTSPEKLERAKITDLNDEEMVRMRTAAGEAKVKIEREILRTAHVGVGVGGALTEDIRRIQKTTGEAKSWHDLMPGGETVKTFIPPSPTDRLNVLLMGRMDDPMKGGGDALAAVKHLNDGGANVHLTVRGANPDKLQETQAEADVLAGGTGRVTVKPFTKVKQDLVDDMHANHVVIMPSKTEGFGLVATEAAAHCIPILVNRDSGAAKFLQDPVRGAEHLGRDSVVMTPEDASQRHIAWAEAIGKVQDNWADRKVGAYELHKVLKNYTWENAGTALVEAGMAAKDGNVRGSVQLQSGKLGMAEAAKLTSPNATPGQPLSHQASSTPAQGPSTLTTKSLGL
ncbi:glycosyltransferase family 4 protein [Streptomyces sp. NBC_00234]|uniref:glycosyltransferase family 4 protein n=1 Tax=Streptomyces sp. NBC_00234 TaxID=2903638 RepID=UPI002E2870DF|nr:glycosyltransferase family 4 protein [Streptomyces sp. NBC_00234]